MNDAIEQGKQEPGLASTPEYIDSNQFTENCVRNQSSQRTDKYPAGENTNTLHSMRKRDRGSPMPPLSDSPEVHGEAR